MARHPKHNVVEARTSGYIAREKLETFLKAKFKVSSLTEFEIKVCPATMRTRASEAEIRIGKAKQMGILGPRSGV
jgi:hypothetical protein